TTKYTDRPSPSCPKTANTGGYTPEASRQRSLIKSRAQGRNTHPLTKLYRRILQSIQGLGTERKSARPTASFSTARYRRDCYRRSVSNPRAWADPLNWRDPRLGLHRPNGFGGPPGQK